MRLFTAIALPDDVRAHVAEVQTRLKERVRGQVSWTAPANFHVTLKFLGEVAGDPVEALRRSFGALEVEMMRLQAVHVQCFPPRGPARVLSVGVAGDVDRIGRLFDRIQVACVEYGVRIERRRFTPHITVGRARDGVQIGDLEVDSGPEFVARGFNLISSRLTPSGSVYEVLETFPIAKEFFTGQPNGCRI